MSKVLIIEDDLSLASHLADSLGKEGWNLEHAATGKDGLQLLEHFRFDIVLLDWNLPDIQGIDVCKSIRAQKIATPIIFLTGNDAIQMIETGLDTGADDYLTKPFEIRELLARMRSVLRRSSGLAQENLGIGEIRFDKKAKALLYRDKVLPLTSTESELVEFLLRHTDEMFSSADLFRAVWASDSDSNDTTVRVHIRVLRRKLDLAGFPELIKTTLGKGYFIDSNATQSTKGAGES